MSTSSQNNPAPEPDQRAAYVAGLRNFANFLESTPDVDVPTTQRTLLLSLSSNPAVEEFAAKHGLTVDFDGEGNASADMTFGPVVYHAYGYVDFDAHCDRNAERTARNWADRHGLEIVKPQASEKTTQRAKPSLPDDAPAARLATVLGDKRDDVVAAEPIDATTLDVTVQPVSLSDWQWWLKRVHAEVGQTTFRGSYATAKGHVGQVKVLLAGVGVGALYAADRARNGGAA